MMSAQNRLNWTDDFYLNYNQGHKYEVETI